jgi:transcriptional regulator with XRE-family HTH domain
VELKIILRKIIREKGLTIAGLSRATKVPVQTLHGWLQGIEPKSIRQVKAVADYLGVDLDYLCFGIKPKSENIKIENFENEINAGVFEVVLRRVKKT